MLAISDIGYYSTSALEQLAQVLQVSPKFDINNVCISGTWQKCVGLSQALAYFVMLET